MTTEGSYAGSFWTERRRSRTYPPMGHNETLGQLLYRLNPVLRGWCSYFRGG